MAVSRLGPRTGHFSLYRHMDAPRESEGDDDGVDGTAAKGRAQLFSPSVSGEIAEGRTIITSMPIGHYIHTRLLPGLGLSVGTRAGAGGNGSDASK